jgi:hypothetical protein
MTPGSPDLAAAKVHLPHPGGQVVSKRSSPRACFVCGPRCRCRGVPGCSSRSSPIGTDHWSARRRSSIPSACSAAHIGTGSGPSTVRSFTACCTASPELRPRRGLKVRGSSLEAELRRAVSLPWATARIDGPLSCHVDQIAPSSRSTCLTSLAAMRRTQTCRGPITSKVAQNSKHDPPGHIDSASTSILLPRRLPPSQAPRVG